jgi:hypothetical protein
MAKLVGSDLDFNSAARIVNLPDPTAAQHAATKAYVDSAVEGLAWKDSVRVATATNVNLAAPGAALDGVTMAVNDRFLAPAQTTGSQNGIYIWNGAAVPATRALDMNSAAEVEQAVVTVEEGTSAASTFRQTQVNVTLDTTALVWVSFGTAAPPASQTVAGVAEVATVAEIDTGTDDTRFVSPLGLAGHANRKRKGVGTVGDGSSTSFPINHNFNTKDVHVEVYRNSGNFDTILCDVQRTSVNQVTLIFASPPSAAQFAYVILA